MIKISKNWNKSGIYCIWNINTSKCYVGSSINITNRLMKHRSLLRKKIHSNSHLQNSWNKHGEKHFIMYPLEFCLPALLVQKEQHYIDVLNSKYNITRIVERNIPSLEARLKMSKTRKERIASGIIQKTRMRKIHQYSLDGKYIKSFISIQEAALQHNCSSSSIHRALKGTYKRSGKYLWSYTKHKTISKYTPNKSSNKTISIEMINLLTKEIVYFKSIRECARHFEVSHSTIQRVLSTTGIFKEIFNIKGLLKE